MRNDTFTVANYRVKRICDRGLWLVTAKHLVDVGMLFWRAQEFYESPNPKFVGKAFTFLDYMRWYCVNQSDEKSFTYFSDYAGFNFPSYVLDRMAKLPITDLNKYDMLLSRIADEIDHRQLGQPFYLVGAPAESDAITHEIAHGLFYLYAPYRQEMREHVVGMARNHKLKMRKALANLGYGKPVLVDETQAYMATGVMPEVGAHLESGRPPFMLTFDRYRQRYIRL